MAKTLILELPDELEEKLQTLSVRQAMPLEEMVLAWLRRLAQFTSQTERETVSMPLDMPILEGNNDPVLQPDDPVLNLMGVAASEIGDLSVYHDKYLYQKGWLKDPGMGTSR